MSKCQFQRSPGGKVIPDERSSPINEKTAEIGGWLATASTVKSPFTFIDWVEWN